MKLISKILILGWFTAGFSHADQCFDTAQRLKETLGIEGDYDPRLRVERKSTNTKADAKAFVEFIARVLRPAKRESFELRDQSSDAARVLVTSTNYPFSKQALSQLNVKVRVREYGERRAGINEPFTSTTGAFVNLEIKAKLPAEGVVVKPILRVPKSALADLFGSEARFTRSKDALLQTILAANPKLANGAAVVGEVLSTLASLHRLESGRVGGRVPCENVEYQRNAYVMKVSGPDGQLRKVQMTFDQAVSLREGIDATKAPDIHGQSAPSAKYPPDAVVIEMKTDLWLNERFLADPQAVRRDFPAYYLVRSAYEQLQATTVDGFRADSGKAAHFRRSNLSLEQFVHFSDL